MGGCLWLMGWLAPKNFVSAPGILIMVHQVRELGLDNNGSIFKVFHLNNLSVHIKMLKTCIATFVLFHCHLPFFVKSRNSQVYKCWSQSPSV